MAVMATLGQAKTRSQQLHLGLPNVWTIFSCFSQTHEQEAGSEAEEPGYKSVDIWDASIVGSNLTCYATMPVPEQMI